MQINFTPLPDLSDQIKSLNLSEGFFNQYPWFELLAKHLFNRKNDSLGYLIGSDDKNQPKILFPIRYCEHRWRLSQFISLTSYYSPIYNCTLFDTDQRIEPVIAFFDALKHSNFHWHRVILYALPEDTAHIFSKHLTASGMPCIRFFCYVNWYLPVSYRDFETYWASRSSRLRNTVKRKYASFTKLEHTRIELYLTADALTFAISHYQEVYQESWKHTEGYPELMSDLLHLAARQKALRLAIAYVDKEPIAAQFWIVADNTAYIYKLAYKESHKSLGIGSVLTFKLMQYVIDVDKVVTVDYLTGDDAYKQDWMTHRRERWGIEIFNTSTLPGFCLHLWENLKIRLKTLKNTARQFSTTLHR
jgi:hypothetical protein